MKPEAQLYTDADYVRIFDEQETYVLDAALHGNTDPLRMADNALTNTAFRRTGKWIKREYGHSCTVERRK